MNLRAVGSETSVNDSVQTNEMINKRLKCSTTTPKKKWQYIVTGNKVYYTNV
jgi:hypothetical protein